VAYKKRVNTFWCLMIKVWQKTMFSDEDIQSFQTTTENSGTSYGCALKEEKGVPATPIC
jgi:hypothetical protein